MQLNNNCYNSIKEFFENDFDKNKTQIFFDNLHQFEISPLKNKKFKLCVEDINKMWGIFMYENYYDTEIQTLKLHSFDNYENTLYKKSIQLLTYFHEATHEKQRDNFIYNNLKNIKETSQYNNLINLEIFCNVEAETCNYEQLLSELDAIHNSIVQFNTLQQEGIIPITKETLSVVLYACVRYFASLNGAKHHTYCPENFTNTCDELIIYYKNFYKNLVVKFYSNSKNLNDIINDSEMLSVCKEQEFKKINIDNIKEELNTKTICVEEIMNDVYKQLLGLYTPSKQILKHFNSNISKWNNILSNNNIVKMSALICDDLHSQFNSCSSTTILKDIDLDYEK